MGSTNFFKKVVHEVKLWQPKPNLFFFEQNQYTILVPMLHPFEQIDMISIEKSFFFFLFHI